MAPDVQPTVTEMLRSLKALHGFPARPQLVVGLESIHRKSIGPSASMRIIEDASLTETVEDWSEVRSPSRAARRRRQGHRQRIRYVQRPKPGGYAIDGALVMHPETWRAVRDQLSFKADGNMNRTMMNAFAGRRVT
ncbi:hypothetical protein [Methylobacterium haplocladii]|uniref:hypothetical protein n=1 Tax=Methylobacterium haplocladii TaxID=1176176 RepID=UPI0011BD833D|nr:hypothetical protein [Methylobacterium haplocladii]